MLLCQGPVLLTEVNFQPRFHLVPLAGLNAFCTCGSRVHANVQMIPGSTVIIRILMLCLPHVGQIDPLHETLMEVCHIT